MGNSVKSLLDMEKKGKKNENKEPLIFTSYHNETNYLYEQGYDPVTNKSYFIKWHKWDKEYTIVPYFYHNEIKHLPMYGDELAKQAVILPVKPLPYGSIKQLEKNIKEHIHQWLDITPEYEQLACYNILLSWVYQRFNTLSYTRALGDTGTGKSRFLFTLGHLHYKPMLIAGALTPAVIFRVIDKWQGTLLIDEGDQDNSEETNSFIKIMNCGYEKGMSVARCDKNHPNKIDFFNVFCPKVLTTRRRFQDKATEARCMTTIMTQTYRLDIKENFTKEYYDSVEELRGKLLMWRFHNYDTIDPEAGLRADLSRFEPRLRQVNRSFISLFVDDKEAMANFYQYLDTYQETLIEERATSFDGIIINVLAEMVSNGWEHITCTDLKEIIDQKGIDSKYPVTVRKLGNLIRGVGLIIHPMKVQGVSKKVILLDKRVLGNIFSRYIYDEAVVTKLSQKGYPVTEVTEDTETNKIIICTMKEKEVTSNRLGNYGNLGNRVTEEVVNIPEKRSIITIKEITDYLLKNGVTKIEILKDILMISDTIIDKLLATGTIVEMPKGSVRVL